MDIVFITRIWVAVIVSCCSYGCGHSGGDAGWPSSAQLDPSIWLDQLSLRSNEEHRRENKKKTKQKKGQQVRAFPHAHTRNVSS